MPENAASVFKIVTRVDSQYDGSQTFWIKCIKSAFIRGKCYVKG